MMYVGISALKSSIYHKEILSKNHIVNNQALITSITPLTVTGFINNNHLIPRKIQKDLSFILRKK